MIATARQPVLVCLLGFALVVGVATAGAQQVPDTARGGIPSVDRVAGMDRVSTAAALAELSAPDVVEVAYIASAADFPDALAGGPAAARQQGVLLLTDAAELSEPTRAALQRLDPLRIAVLGGQGVVSQGVEEALAAFTSGAVTRLSGDDRAATAAAVSQATSTPGGTVMLAARDTFPDALSGGPLAVAVDAPVLLTNRGSIPAATIAELDRLEPTRVIVLGGTGAIEESVVAEVRTRTGATLDRIGGADRIATSILVAEELGETDGAVLASADDFPDALAAIGAAVGIGGPLLLTTPLDLSAATAAFIEATQPQTVLIAGGPVAVDPHVGRVVEERLGIAPDGDTDEDPFPPDDIYLAVADADLDALYADPFGQDRVDGVVRRTPTATARAAGVEFRGNSSRNLPKKSFDIRFDEDQPFLFGSTDRFDLNAMYTDPSGMRERLAFGVFDDLGVPTSRTRHVNLTLNGIYEGLFTYFERAGEELLVNRGLNPGGMLLRDELRDFSDAGVPGFPARRSTFGVDLETVGDVPAYFDEVFSSDAADPDLAILEDLVRFVHDTPAGPDFDDGFRSRVDVDAFANWIAGNVLTGDIDSYADDYHLYYDLDDPSAGWQFIPRDNDLSFGSHSRAGQTANAYWSYQHANVSTLDNELVRKALDTPTLLAEVDARIAVWLDEAFTTERLGGRIETIGDAISESMAVVPSPEAFLRQGQQHFGLLGFHDLHRENLLDFVELRRAHLDRMLRIVEGDAYTATVDLSTAEAGDRVLFTDPTGWTIGALSIEQAQGAGLATMTVGAGPQVGVDREWTVTTEGSLSGSLSLYFRNEIDPPPGVPDENWTRSSDAIGSEMDLQMLQGQVVLGSAANPWSNKVTAAVALPPGATTFTLRD